MRCSTGGDDGYLVLCPRNSSGVREEHRQSAIAALGDVVSDTREDDAREAGHWNGVASGRVDG